MFLEKCIIIHLFCRTLAMRRTLPNFVLYVDLQNAEKMGSIHTCFATHILQNKELFLLKQ